MSVLLTPFMMLAFVLLHAVYHLHLLVQQASTWIHNASKRQPNRLQPSASFTSLQELLDAHECPSSSVRVPNHLAIVLADAAPSSIRLYLSTLFAQLGRRNAPAPSEIWRSFRSDYQVAVEAKHASDAAAIIHLARISGVRQLSVYTSRPLSPSALESLCRTLQLGYKTKAVISSQPASGTQLEAGANDDTAANWSRYAELRRRTTRTPARGSDSSSPSSPDSPASSDSETGPSSLDETLASSYTADSDAAFPRDAFSATVDLRIGLHPFPPTHADTTHNHSISAGSDAAPSPPPSPLQVTLLSEQDGQVRFADLVSEHIHQRATAYLSDVLQPDIHAAVVSPSRRFSASSLRKAWVGKRPAFTSELTVTHLDNALKGVGYMDEPDLLAVFGGRPRLRKLYGFPAWPLRLTELFYDASTGSKNRPYASRDFVAALQKFATSQHRYGK